MALNWLTSDQELILRQYASRLCESNRITNLVGWKKLEDIWKDGILFSVIALRSLPISPSGKCLDVGSGAGIVGIPVAVLFPKTEVVLLESHSRKVMWLNKTIKELKLDNVVTVCQRAEVAGHDPCHREQYHWVFSRALASMATSHELGFPFVRIGGFAVQIKTPEARSEFVSSLPVLDVLGAVPRWIVQFESPRPDRSGALFVFQKKHPTPPRFPRKPGIPQKRPLRSPVSPGASLTGLSAVKKQLEAQYAPLCSYLEYDSGGCLYGTI